MHGRPPAGVSEVENEGTVTDNRLAARRPFQFGAEAGAGGVLAHTPPHLNV